jgi:RimJ/RimL family protein N-acetyltransferase
MPAEITLRDVSDADLELFFENQLDAEAARMADFPQRDREAYLALWGRILANETIVKRTVLCDGAVAGNVVSFLEDDGRRQIGYWLGRTFWGRGIATRAVALLLDLVSDRPLHAEVVPGNPASRRVLEKNGFTVTEARSDVLILELP